MSSVNAKREINLLLGQNLKRLRIEKGLTQDELAELAETDKRYISAMENGRGIGKNLLDRLSRALKADIKEFTKQLSRPMYIPPPVGEIAVISMGQGGDNGFYEDAYPVGHGFKYIKRPYDVIDENAYAVEIRGDSMSPRYEEGEIVIASPAKEVVSSDFVVTKLKTGELMIKRIRFKNGFIILESVNPAFEVMVLKPEEIIFHHKIVWKKEKV